MTPLSLLLPVVFVIGCCHAFFEDIDEAPPEDVNEVRVHHFNDDMVRCYKEAAANVSAAGFEGTLANCCVRDYWSLCVRSVPLAKECNQLLEMRIEEIESSMVSGIECAKINTDACPHVKGAKLNHYISKERSLRYTGAATVNLPPGLLPTCLLVVALLYANKAQLL